MVDHSSGYWRPSKVPKVCLTDASKPKRGHGTVATGSKSSRSASGVARYLNKIPHNTFVDAFHGQGNVYRRTERADKEILNDISSRRLSCSKALTCRTKSQKQCDRFKEAKKTTQDYRRVVSSNDKKDTLIYMDPPYTGTKYKAYTQNGITPKQLHDTSEKVKRASIAVSYSDNPEFKRLFCNRGYKCHRIANNIFDNQYYELLAVKKR